MIVYIIYHIYNKKLQQIIKSRFIHRQEPLNYLLSIKWIQSKKCSQHNRDKLFCNCAILFERSTSKCFYKNWIINLLILFSPEIFSNYISRKHHVDCCIFLLNGVVGHHYWRDIWYSTRGKKIIESRDYEVFTLFFDVSNLCLDF